MKDSIRRRMERNGSNTLQGRTIDIDLQKLLGTEKKPLPSVNEFVARPRPPIKKAQHPIDVINRFIRIIRLLRRR